MKNLLVIIALLLVSTVDAKSFVWKVEKDGKHAYIGGTVHVLRGQDVIPEVYHTAFKEADVLVTEVDIQEMASAAMSMMAMGRYQDGMTLDKALSPEVFAKFEAFCKKNKFPVDSFLRLKPTMVSINIVMSMMLREGVSPEGVDMYFTKKALEQGKKRDALESVKDQFDALFNDKVNPDQIILTTIRDSEHVKELLDGMIGGLFAGDTELFVNDFLGPMKEETPEFYKSLIEVRNNNWMPKVEQLLATPEVELILVGGLHLVGDIGVIHQLEEKGYKVTQLD